MRIPGRQQARGSQQPDPAADDERRELLITQ
jgi:hypothetical protein